MSVGNVFASTKDERAIQKIIRETLRVRILVLQLQSGFLRYSFQKEYPSIINAVNSKYGLIEDTHVNALNKPTEVPEITNIAGPIQQMI